MSAAFIGLDPTLKFKPATEQLSCSEPVTMVMHPDKLDSYMKQKASVEPEVTLLSEKKYCFMI